MLRIQRPPSTTRPYTLFPYSTLFLSSAPGSRRRAPKASTKAGRKTSMTMKSDAGSPPARARPASRATSRSQERSEEHTSELQSLMRTSYAVFCLKKKKHKYENNASQNLDIILINYPYICFYQKRT